MLHNGAKLLNVCRELFVEVLLLITFEVREPIVKTPPAIIFEKSSWLAFEVAVEVICLQLKVKPSITSTSE